MVTTLIGWVLQLAGLILGWLQKGKQSAAQASTTQSETLGATTEALQTETAINANAEKANQAAATVDAQHSVDPGSVRDGSDGFSRD